MSAQQQELQELDRISILFQLGFRPFFLGAGMIAVLFMILWTASYSFGWAHSFPRMSSIHWHAHEMLYGYAMAVIAGFLLTAICNWTTACSSGNRTDAPLFILAGGKAGIDVRPRRFTAADADLRSQILDPPERGGDETNP